MKFKKAIAIGALGCVSLAASAQQSPFGTPALSAQATAGTPVVLKLTGVTVTDPAGQPIGPIEHLLLSPTGCADLAVLSVGQKMVAVPWQLVTSSSASAGAARAEAAATPTHATLAVKVDRAVLQQAPTITVNQLSQPQMVQQVVQQVNTYYSQHQSSSAGGTGSQTNVNAGAGASTTNSTGSTNAAIGGSITNTAGTTNRTGIVGANTNQSGIVGANTNQTGSLTPTGPSNAAPGRPAFETNRPGRPSITPPANRPPANRPPANRPPTNTPGATPPGGTPGGATPNDPNQP